MAKFNSSPNIKTTNHEGHVAYKMSNRSKLVTQILTSFFNEKKFYGDNSKEMMELIPKVIKEDPQFVSNLAVFARREFNMRSVAHVLTAFLAHEVEGKPYVKSTVKGVALRGDDITEIMAFYLSTWGKPIPNSLKKGIGEVMQTLDEYSLAKYKGSGKEVKMRDLLCLCRPKPLNNEQEDLWKRCLEGKLETPYTWETELSAKGNTKEVWEELIASHKVGYMAMLRNLRNIINAGPDNLDAALNYIRNPEAVRKSKQLPFRFLNAYRSLNGLASSKVFDALEDAIDISVENLPKIPGRTIIAMDTSGSMSSCISSKSDVKCCDISVLLGLIANRICNDSIVYTFNHNIKRMDISRRGGLIENTIRYARPSGGTDMRLPFQAMIDGKIKADRIIILSDNECNGGWYGKSTIQSYADQYRRMTGNDIWVHAIDLQGYGTQQFHGKHTNIIAGWSEKVFDFILLAEQGEGNLEKRIEEYCW